MQFITRTRIEAACDDLLSSSNKLSVIAKENGFLTKFLHPTFSQTNENYPLKYRKQKDLFNLNASRKFLLAECNTLSALRLNSTN